MMSAHRFDDGENLLLLVAGQSGFELSFELGLGAALPTLLLSMPRSSSIETPRALANLGISVEAIALASRS